MKSVIFLIFIYTNDITAKTINVKALNFCHEPIRNMTDISDDEHDSKKQETSVDDQVKNAALTQVETKSEEEVGDIDANEHSNDGNIEINATTEVTEDDSDKKKRDAYNDNNTNSQFIDINSTHTPNSNYNSNKNISSIEVENQNKTTLDNHSDITNIREVRSQLLNHLLEYFMNIIKDEKHLETRKKYGKDKMKLEDKLRNYYHSDFDHLFYEDDMDFNENDTDYSDTRRKIQKDQETLILDKENERDDITDLDTTATIEQMESKPSVIVKATHDKTNPDIKYQSNEKEVSVDEKESSVLFLQNTNEESSIEIKDSLTVTNTENILKKTQENSNTLDEFIVEDTAQVKEKYNTEITTEKIKESINNTELRNTIYKTENNAPGEQNQTYQIHQNDDNKAKNSKKINSENEPTHTWLKEISFGSDNNEQLNQEPKTSDGCCKNNYLLQINIQL